MSSKPPEDDGDKLPEELSSTLQHVQNVQGDDGDVSWANLHDKIVKWVGEAAYGQNLPADKSRDDLTQEVHEQGLYEYIRRYKPKVLVMAPQCTGMAGWNGFGSRRIG